MKMEKRWSFVAAVLILAMLLSACSALGAAPNSPADLTVTAHGEGSVLVSWEEAADAESYDVEYYSRAAGEWKSDSDYVSGTSYVSTGLTDYESYKFRIRAVNNYGCSDWVTVTYEVATMSPAPPSNVIARQHGPESASIVWDESLDATSYEVQYYSRSSGTWKNDSDYTGGMSYISTGLSGYNSYQYRIRAVNSFGTSEWTVFSVDLEEKELEAPAHVNASQYSINSAMLSWDESPGANSYEVQYFGRVSQSWLDDPDYSGGTSYISTGLDNYDMYQYRIRAVNEYGESPWVVVAFYKVLIEIEAPRNLEVTQQSMTTARLSWSGSVGANYYEVQYYSRASGAWKDDPDYDGGTSYVSTGLDNYDSFEYRVRAVNTYGYSDWTEITFYKTILNIEAPRNLYAVQESMNSAMLSWDESPDAASYDVQYFGRVSQSWLDDPDYDGGTSYISTGLDNYDSYRYRVRAVNKWGYSDWIEVTFVKQIFEIAPPTNFMALQETMSSVRLSWDESPDATSYEVQYFGRASQSWLDDPDYSRGTSYVSTGLDNYDSYEYRVRAVSSMGVSPWVSLIYYKPDYMAGDYMRGE